MIAINLCGHAHFDMQAYRSFLDGQLVNYEYPQERITEALAELARRRLTGEAILLPVAATEAVA